MLKDEIGKYYFEGNYNCAETILRAGNDYYELGLHDRDMILVGVYGAGIQCGNTCGAILAAAGILSMKYVESKAHESEHIKIVGTELIRKFNLKYGSTLCKDIKAQSFKPEYRCLKTVEAACDILEEVIQEYEAARA
ncbi:MAG: C-GCAxxG-C-C family protein [Lachnospiraceae bacterium]|nr:C-GCAxxG-C-C family protein [Lachnospiraceae bacterium]